MAKVIIELEDMKDEQGIDRVLTCVRFEHPVKIGTPPTKAENFGLAVAQVVDEASRQKH